MVRNDEASAEGRKMKKKEKVSEPVNAYAKES